MKHAALAYAQPAAAANAWRAYQSSTGSIDEKDLIERYLPLVRNVVDRIKINLPAHVDVAKGLPIAYAVSLVLIAMSVLLIYADVVNPIKLGG